MKNMVPETADDKINLLDLLSVLLRRKWMLIGVTLSAMLCVFAFSIGSLLLPPERSWLPDEYTTKTLMLINDASSSGGGIASMLSSSGLGGLAGLAGIDVSGVAGYRRLAVYLAGTNTFLDSVVDHFGLIERYRIKKSVRAESRKALRLKLIASVDEASGVFSLAFTDLDPVFAQAVVNYCVGYFEERFAAMGLDKNRLQKENLEISISNSYDEIRRLELESRQLDQSASTGRSDGNIPSIILESNRLKREVDAQVQVYMQLKVQYEMLKVAMASETPIFQVLELADVPDRKSGPGRGMVCIIVTSVSFLGAVLLAFIIEATVNLSKNPDAMAKLQGKAV